MSLDQLFHSLKLSEKSAVSLDKTEEDYILDVQCQKSSEEDCLVAATSSNRTIQLFKRSNLTNIGTIKGHKETLTGLCWGKKNSNVLYTASADKTIRSWDVRAKLNKEVQRFEGAQDCNSMFLCVDINSSDLVLTAGLEADKAEEPNAYVLFWDTRNSELMGCYSESHQDDITQVCFHPENPDSLSTGSMDGLVCTYDVSQINEEDALQYAFNSCSTVLKVGWCGRDSQQIYCTTHIDTVCLWDGKEGDSIIEVPNLKESLEGDSSIDYVVDCIQYSEKTLTLLAGNHNGEMKIVECSNKAKDKSRVIHTLGGGHKATVRSCQWDPKSQSLITGAEDSMLCLWSDRETDFSKTENVKLKAKSGKKRSLPY